MHINGWDVIETYLKKRKIKQRELALNLNMSDAAVSQAKHSLIHLNPQQINDIVKFLDMAEEDILTFYGHIFNARVCGDERFVLRNNQMAEQKQSKLLPLLKIADLSGFDPRRHRIGDYAEEASKNTLEIDSGHQATFVVHTPYQRYIFIDGNREVRNNDLVFIYTGDGEAHMRYLKERGGKKILIAGEFGGRKILINNQDELKNLRLAAPIVEIKFHLLKK